MENLRLRKNPEAEIQKELIKYLKIRDWLVRVLHADYKNKGWPDLYITHTRYGQRWVEVKLPGMVGSKFTNAQIEWFPKMCAHGTPIWILTGANDIEYAKLFKPQNFSQIYLYEQMK